MPINKTDGSGTEFRGRISETLTLPNTGLNQTGYTSYVLRKVITMGEQGIEIMSPFHLTIDKNPGGGKTQVNRLIDIFWGGPYLNKQSKYREQMWEKLEPTPSHELCYRLMRTKNELSILDEHALDTFMINSIIPMREEYDKTALEEYVIGEHGIEKKGE